jgi:hypothetical protein
MQGQFWVALVGQIIIVRSRGKTLVHAVHERHARVLRLERETGCKKVLFDFLEGDAPSFEVMEAQKLLNAELKALGFSVAVLVPNSRLAYHGRIAFPDDNHKIVYEDLTEAVNWLQAERKSVPL